MRLSQALWIVVYILIAPAVISTLVLFKYPLVFGCEFPKPLRGDAEHVKSNNSAIPHALSVAPFRLLALGDPQLEGDTSLPDPNAPLLPSLRNLWSPDYTDFSRGFPTEKHTVVSVLAQVLKEDIPRAFQIYRKRLDLLGNDYYLNHIYKTLDSYLEPTHVTVLGDLIGSQWIGDAEFESRKWRFWNRVFKGGRKVEDGVTNGQRVNANPDDKGWRKRIINVAGNHDIGYAGDVTRHRVTRFEEAYGKVNWHITFEYSSPDLDRRQIAPSIRLVILNDMSLDGPAYDTALQAESYNFLEQKVKQSSASRDDHSAATILLTHIPLYKADSLCVDGPLFEFGPTGLREQNHLSYASSAKVLNDVFGTYNPALGETQSVPVRHPGVILTGHDHEGCQVVHHQEAEGSGQQVNLASTGRSRGSDKPGVWYMDTSRIASAYSIPEITVRSMMGSYGGNAGLLSGWFDAEAGLWRFAYDTCAIGVQHWWWAVHVLDLITWCVLGAALLASTAERLMPDSRREDASKRFGKPKPSHPEPGLSKR